MTTSLHGLEQSPVSLARRTAEQGDLERARRAPVDRRDGDAAIQPALHTPVFNLHGACVDYGAVRALRPTTLRIVPGERVALIGANGCGKSTLLRLLHGLIEPTAGSLQRIERARQAMLFQRPHMLRTSAQTQVALALWLRGQRWRRANELAREALSRVGLAEVARRNARALSGGQQQRLALAQAWACQPAVLLLDEPTASLDPHASRDVEALVDEFARAGEGAAAVTMVFSSHNLGQVRRLAHRVIYLEHGRVLADLPTAEFFSGTLPPAARLFLEGELV